MSLYPSGHSDEPLLRTRSSGLSGSGYALVHDRDEGGKIRIVPGITTVTKWLPDEGLRQYEADQVAIKATTNIDALLNRTELEGFYYLRYAGKNNTKRLAAIGTNFHNYIEADLGGLPLPAIEYHEVNEMVEKWQELKWEHSIQPIAIEGTVVNRSLGYAGTFDLIANVDGVPTLLDAKTSTAIRTGHYAQLAALGAADEMMLLDPDGEYEHLITPPNGWEGEVRGSKAVTRWSVGTVPSFSQYGFLHARPAGFDRAGDPTEAFCEIHIVPEIEIEEHWEVFRGMLSVAQAVSSIEKRRKAQSKEEA